MQGETRRGALEIVCVELFRRLSRHTNGVVLVIDDAHDMDSGSESLLG